MATSTDSYQALLTANNQIGTLLGNIELYKNNPSGIQRTILTLLSDITSGKLTVVDPTSPFAFLMNVSAVSTASFIIADEAASRKLYPALAQTQEDLYRHMSDGDYSDRFSTPASTTFNVYLNQTELLSKMVVDSVTGLRTATIPRNTEFSVAGVTFSMQYPINIRQSNYGNLQITYDNATVSPLKELISNVVPWSYHTPVGAADTWIKLSIAVDQFKVNSTSTPITAASVFKNSYTITDNYYYTRVYYKNTATGKWKEIATTHTAQVYDAGTATALIQVTDKTVTVTIPQVYITTNTITGTLRVDIYETKGPLNMVLENYQYQAFSANWRAIDTADQTGPAAVFPTLANMAVWSTDIVSGGTSPMPFTTLRSQVINNTVGPVNTPITNVQIATALQDNGYHIVPGIDVVTNRVFLATKVLPEPVITTPDANGVVLLTAAATSVLSLNSNIKSLLQYSSVIDNGQRTTITPKLIYKNVNGLVQPVNATDYTALMAKSSSAIALDVNANNYVYTPFHYVLDTTTNYFSVRPYYLNGPVASSLNFVSNNPTAQIQVNTTSYSLGIITGGYQLTVVCTGSDTWTNLNDGDAQALLAFKPANQTAFCFLKGILAATTNGSRIYQFNISTNYDIDSNDTIYFTNFLEADTVPKLFGSSLSSDFSIIYTASNARPTGWIASNLDSLLPTYILPSTAYAVTEEVINVEFGKSLGTLWARSRTNVSQTPFKRYTSDIPLIYQQDVFEKNTTTGGYLQIVNGKPTMVKLHTAGDPVLNARGLQVFKHRAGDVITGADGNALPTDAAYLVRQIDMFFIDATYLFATDSAAINYRKTINQTVVGWLTSDLEAIKAKILEQTKLYFYPKTTMGSISAVTESGAVSTIEARQSFIVNLYVNDAVYSDNNIQANMKKSTIKLLNNYLKDTQVSISNITSALGVLYGNDVIGFNIHGLGGRDLSAITITNEAQLCSIRKLLVAQPDGSLIVKEDVTMNFIRHVVPSSGSGAATATNTITL